MSGSKIDISEVLDRANDTVSELFEKYCFENGMIPKEVCVSAKAKGIPKYLVCRLFNDLPSGASPCVDGTNGETRQRKQAHMKTKKPTAKKPATAAKVAAKPAKKPATVKKPAKVAAKPAPAKKSAKKSAKK